MTVAAEPVPQLVVDAFQPTAVGFTALLNRPFDGSPLNLYGTETGGFGPADVTVVGAASGPVRGSLIAEASTGKITFIRTGGPLPADTYTVTLRSSANGFHDPAGELIDGNRDGVAGGDYVTSFTVTPSPLVLSVPDFARGPGQAVNVPATGVGIPIRLSDGSGCGVGRFYAHL